MHRNAGNARYCEYCGKPTMLLNKKLFKLYTEVQAEQEGNPFPFDEELPFN